MSPGETKGPNAALQVPGRRRAMAGDADLSDEVLVLVLMEALRGRRANVLVINDGTPCRPAANHR